MKKVLSMILCVVMIASLAILATSAIGQPSIQASTELQENGPTADTTTVTITGVNNSAEVKADLQEIEDAASLYNLVSMDALKASLGITAEGDVSEDGLAIYTAFAIADNGATPNADGKVEVTLSGLNVDSFRYFTFIYKSNAAKTEAEGTVSLLADTSDWKVMDADDITVNDDGTVTLAVSEFGTYAMVTSNGSNLVNPFTADSMWWIFVVAGVAVAAIAVVVVVTSKKKIAD